MGACVRKVTLMNAWYLLYCNNNDLDRIAYRCKTMNVVAFCPRYIKRGLRANGTKTYVKEIIRCLYLNLELSVPLLKYPLAT